MHFAERRPHQLDVRKFLDHPVDHREEGVGIEFRFGLIDRRPGDPQSLLQVFFVADQRVDVGDDAADDFLPLRVAADRRPQLGPVIEIERIDGAGGMGGLHPFDDDFGGRLGEGGENPSRMEPADARP